MAFKFGRLVLQPKNFYIFCSWFKQQIGNTMKDLTITRPFCEEEYNELLRQAVAVIETSR